MKKKQDEVVQVNTGELCHVFVFKHGRSLHGEYPNYVGYTMDVKNWVNARIGYFDDYGYEFEFVSATTGRLLSMVFNTEGLLK